jgi:hypothetical protein
VRLSERTTRAAFQLREPFGIWRQARQQSIGEGRVASRRVIGAGWLPEQRDAGQGCTAAT